MAEKCVHCQKKPKTGDQLWSGTVTVDFPNVHMGTRAKFTVECELCSECAGLLRHRVLAVTCFPQNYDLSEGKSSLDGEGA